jgi:hypothetical protein
LVNRETTEWFKATVGNRQGDSISPLAYIIYLERIMDGIQEIAKKAGIVHGRNISNLKFVDDIDLLDRSYERL